MVLTKLERNLLELQNAIVDNCLASVNILTVITVKPLHESWLLLPFGNSYGLGTYIMLWLSNSFGTERPLLEQNSGIRNRPFRKCNEDENISRVSPFCIYQE